MVFRPPSHLTPWHTLWHAKASKKKRKRPTTSSGPGRRPGRGFRPPGFGPGAEAGPRRLPGRPNALSGAARRPTAPWGMMRPAPPPARPPPPRRTRPARQIRPRVPAETRPPLGSFRRKGSPALTPPGRPEMLAVPCGGEARRKRPNTTRAAPHGKKRKTGPRDPLPPARRRAPPKKIQILEMEQKEEKEAFRNPNQANWNYDCKQNKRTTTCAGRMAPCQKIRGGIREVHF